MTAGTLSLDPPAVFHGEAAPPPHDCRPRIYADCTACGRRVVLCEVSRPQIDAILARTWRCADCEATDGC